MAARLAALVVLAALVAQKGSAELVHEEPGERLLVGGHSSSTLEYDLEHDAPRLPPGSDEALEHLRTHGYVVLAGVLNASEVEAARERLWSFLEGAGAGVRRHDPRTWGRVEPNQYGIVWNHGAAHSELMWRVRTAPALLQTFERLWGTDDLLVSFEGFSFFPPVEHEGDFGTPLAEGWFHTDQNGVSRPGLQTIQSFVSLYDQDASTGAFLVVPGSHEHHGALTARVRAARPGTPDDQQFLLVPPDDPLLTAAPPTLVRCRAGDAVLWDSRAVHCNTPSLARTTAWRRTARAEPPAHTVASPPQPARVVAYASFAPRVRAPHAVLGARKRAFFMSQACTHWPFDAKCVPMRGAGRAKLPTDLEDDRQLLLVGFPNSTDELAKFRRILTVGHAQARADEQAARGRQPRPREQAKRADAGAPAGPDLKEKVLEARAAELRDLRGLHLHDEL